MFDEPLALLSLIATLGLLFVSRRAANAAKRSADIAAREFRLLRRPSVDVKWSVNPIELDHKLTIYAQIREVGGIATTLHSVEACAMSFLDRNLEVEETATPNAILGGDLATFDIPVELEVPEPPAGPLGSTLPVARLGAKVVISVADDEADQETWQSDGMLYFDRSRQQFVARSNLRMRRLAVQKRGPRSRVLDPPLRAWQRWWDSVQ